MSARCVDWHATARRLDLDDLATSIPGFRAPRQDRSREKTYAIMAATARLLDARSFQDISLRLISQISGCVTGSIYARFEDKSALLAVLYELKLLEYADQICAELEACVRAGKDFDMICSAVLAVIDACHRKDENFLGALVASRDVAIQNRIRRMGQNLSQTLSEVLGPSLGSTPQAIQGNVDLAVRQVLASYRDYVNLGFALADNPDPAIMAKLFALTVRHGPVAPAGAGSERAG